MATAQANATISAAPDQIWSLLVNPARYSEWVVGQTGLNGTAPAELIAGSSFGQNLTVMGMPAAVTWSVTEANAPSRLAMSGAGPMGITIESLTTLSPAEGGSQIDITYTFSGGAVFAVASQLEKEISGTLAESLVNLAKLV